MKKTWKMSLLLIALIIWGALVPVHSEEKTGDTGRSFLWELEGTAGKSYLLGSVHLLKKEHYPLKQVIEQSFEQSDVLAVEADLSGDKIMSQAMVLMQKGMYSGEETFKDNISPETYQKVETKLKELGMDIDGVKKFKPWFLAMTLSSMELVKMGFSPEYGIDLYFLGKAGKEESKKEIAELEGVDFQIALLDGLTKEENEGFLISTIQESERMGKEMDNIIKAWLNGDLENMEQLLNENTKETPAAVALYKKLLDDRNIKMVEKIEGYLNSGKTHFIVAGAAHMIGEKGIVQLLKNRRIKIRQL
jgi:uncharacterized protein YbaP (TraB family)